MLFQLSNRVSSLCRECLVLLSCYCHIFVNNLINNLGPVTNTNKPDKTRQHKSLTHQEYTNLCSPSGVATK